MISSIDIDDKEKINKIKELTEKVNLIHQHYLLAQFFRQNNIFSYKIVSTTNYYNYPLEQRQQILGASTTQVMCKTIILENKNFQAEFESNFYKRYYMCIVQYTNEFNAEKIAKLLKKRQNENCSIQLSNKHFHFRLSKEEVAFDMSGYYFNCITPYLMKCKDLEILFPKNLLEIYPYYFWLGAGEIELKVGISIQDFFKLYKNQMIVGDVATN